MGNLQVRFLEGWAPAMAPGYSTKVKNHAFYSLTGRADLTAVAEDRGAAGYVRKVWQIHLAGAGEIAGRSREFSCPPGKVHWVSKNCEYAGRDWHRSRCCWVKEQSISGFGDPVMLDMEDDGVSRTGLGHIEKRSTDGTAKVPSGRSQRSVKISTECPELPLSSWAGLVAPHEEEEAWRFPHFLIEEMNHRAANRPGSAHDCSARWLHWDSFGQRRQRRKSVWHFPPAWNCLVPQIGLRIPIPRQVFICSSVPTG